MCISSCSSTTCIIQVPSPTGEMDDLLYFLWVVSPISCLLYFLWIMSPISWAAISSPTYMLLAILNMSRHIVHFTCIWCSGCFVQPSQPYNVNLHAKILYFLWICGPSQTAFCTCGGIFENLKISYLFETLLQSNWWLYNCIKLSCPNYMYNKCCGNKYRENIAFFAWQSLSKSVFS